MGSEVPGRELEIRLHGRGGQGTVTLAALTVDAAFRTGWHALGFPTFGTERTGAPVAAFVRLSRDVILDRSEIRHPNVIVVQDQTLASSVNLLDGLTSDGLVLMNASTVPDALQGARAEVLPVSDLATRFLGSPITSTAMLGFLAAATGLLSIDAIVGAIEDRFAGEIAQKNVAVARAAFDLYHERRAA